MKNEYSTLTTLEKCSFILGKTDKIVMPLLASIAEFERDIIAENMYELANPLPIRIPWNSIKPLLFLSKLEKNLAKTELLIIDELSYLTFKRHQSEMLFQVISERSEKASVIITTNLEFSKWSELFENEMMLSTLIDRVTFKSHILKNAWQELVLIYAKLVYFYRSSATSAKV